MLVNYWQKSWRHFVQFGMPDFNMVIMLASWDNIDQLAGQHVGEVCPRLEVCEYKVLPLIFGEILFQMIGF